MHEFVRKFQTHLGRVAVRMNSCLSMQQCVDNVASTKMVLPDGAEIWIRYPQVADTCEEPCGEAYLSDYDIWSPELAADDLAEWVDMSLECCRRIDAYYDKQRTSMRALNSSVSADVKNRVKNVWRSALAAIDLPRGFRYTGFRTNNLEDWVLSTLVYYSDRIHQQTWLIKSGLILEPEAEGPDVDGWSFQPVYRPLSEAVHNMRPGYSVDMGTELYVEFFNGETPEKRDKQAAYWLVQILSDIVDEAIKNPPPRCYEVLLADNAANLKKSDLDTMTVQGITTLLNAGVLTGEQVLKGKPELFKKLLQKGLVSGEMVARRLPEQVFWLAKNKHITPDYALKLQPSLKDKLVKAGLYSESDLGDYTPEQLLKGVQDGAITPTEAYRANPKLLQSMVEQKLITPQEAYKLDASIITWLLINHYIGRAEAKRVKSDIERYVKQKHKDVDWESLDSGRTDYTHYEGGQVAASVSSRVTDNRISKALAKCIKEDPDTPSATVRVGSFQAMIKPAGYEDNRLITEGNWKDATVYVTLATDYRFIEVDGSYDKRMKGSEVVTYINDAIQKYQPISDDDKPEDLDSSVKDNFANLKSGFKRFQNKAKAVSDVVNNADEKILANAQSVREAAGLNSSTNKAKSKKSPRRLNINSSTSVKVHVAGSRVIDGTHYFCVEGPGVGDNIQYQNQLQTYLPGFTVSSSGYDDRLYVAAPKESKDIVEIAVQHFNRDLISDLNSCDTGATQVGDIAQTTTIPGKKSINSDLTDVNQEINKEMITDSNATLASLTDLDKAKAKGPAWKVTIKYPGDLLSDFTTYILIPALDKASAQMKFNDKMGDKATIISWDEPVNSIDEYREKYPHSNIGVLE